MRAILLVLVSACPGLAQPPPGYVVVNRTPRFQVTNRVPTWANSPTWQYGQSGQLVQVNGQWVTVGGPWQWGQPAGIPPGTALPGPIYPAAGFGYPGMFGSDDGASGAFSGCVGGNCSSGTGFAYPNQSYRRGIFRR